MLALQKLQAKKAEEKPSANEGFTSDLQATKSPRGSANISSHRSSIMDNNKPKEFAAIDTANWDSLQTALATPGADYNARDSEGSTLLLAAARANAPLDVVRKLVEGGASVTAANHRRETPVYHAKGQVLTYLLEKLKEQFPRVVGTLVGDDKNAQRDAIATVYSISFAEQRKLVELPEELWSKAIHLLRVDPSNVTTAQPKEVLCPLLIALCNLTIEDKYAAIVGAQPGSFAFLFGLACKHPSEHVQKYAIHTLFSLSRNDKNKETITTKWFLVLAKLFASPNQTIQTLATAIMAEISIGYDEAKAKATKEVGVLKIVPLLKSGSSEQRYEACRLLTNITNKQAEVQKAAVKEGLLALLLGIATNHNDNNRRTQAAALSAVANILALVGDKETDMGADFARENVTGAIVAILKEARGQDRETEELQEQNLRAIVGITKHKALSAEFIEKEGVEALTPLLGPANKELQKQAVRTIKNLSKKYKKRLAAKETLLDSLQSVATESSSANVQKVAKKTLSRLQLSTK